MTRRNALNKFVFIILLLLPSLISKNPPWTGIDSGQSEKSMSENEFSFRYIKKVSGENLTLECARPIGSYVRWEYPYEGNMELEGFSKKELDSRLRFQHEDLQVKLHIQNLKTTDTGEYSCTVKEKNGKQLRDTIYLFVRESIFLRNKDHSLTANLKNFFVPCRTSSSIQRNKIKLFVENEEWIERCTMNKKLPNPDEVKNIRAHPALNQTNHLKCIKLWENYHPSHGFFITSSEIPLKWSQVNNKKFRCEYENGSVEFFIQATKSIPGFKGGETKLNCTLSNQQLLLLDIKKGRLKLSCPSCDSNIDQTVVNQIFERFEENETLQEAITFWESNNKSFCSCIQQIGAGGNCQLILTDLETTTSEKPIVSGDALKTLLIFVFAFILLVAALLSLYVSFAFWIIHKRRAIGRRIKFELEEETTPLQTIVEMESLVEAQKVDQFKSPSKIAEFEQTYEERPIGVGEFGKVCELIGHNPPAVKKCLKKKAHSESQANLDRFKQEFKILKTLKHSNVVSLIHMESVEGSNDFGIVMEYCQRGNLGELLSNSTIIYSMKTVIIWSRELFDALGYMFRVHKVIHRDIKPENIFVTMEFVLKIGDFGLAKYIEKTCVGSFAGTQRYMSPTRSREGDDLQASHRNDVYALGLVLWEIIERRIVFLEYGSRGSFNPYDFFDIIQKKLKRLIAPNCQKGIREIIRRCTNFNRSSRPMAVEVLEELIRFQQNDSFIDSLNVEPTEEPEQQRVLRPIGFDGTRNQIPVKGLTETSCTSFELMPRSVYITAF